MPQTIEAISHAKAAEVPIVVAVNKIDKRTPTRTGAAAAVGARARPGSVGRRHDLVKVSANGLGIDELLESILLRPRSRAHAPTRRPGRGRRLWGAPRRGRGPWRPCSSRRARCRPRNIVPARRGAASARMMDDKGKQVEERGRPPRSQVLGLVVGAEKPATSSGAPPRTRRRRAKWRCTGWGMFRDVVRGPSHGIRELEDIFSQMARARPDVMPLVLEGRRAGLRRGGAGCLRKLVVQRGGADLRSRGAWAASPCGRSSPPPPRPDHRFQRAPGAGRGMP